MLMNQLLTQCWAGRPCSKKLRSTKTIQKFELWKQLGIALPCSHDKAPAYLCPDVDQQRDFETGPCVTLAPATLEFLQNHCWIHTHPPASWPVLSRNFWKCQQCGPPGPTMKNFLVNADKPLPKVPSLNTIPQQKAATFPAHPLPLGEMSVYMRLLYLYNGIGL